MFAYGRRGERLTFYFCTPVYIKCIFLIKKILKDIVSPQLRIAREEEGWSYSVWTSACRVQVWKSSSKRWAGFCDVRLFKENVVQAGQDSLHNIILTF